MLRKRNSANATNIHETGAPRIGAFQSFNPAAAYLLTPRHQLVATIGYALEKYGEHVVVNVGAGSFRHRFLAFADQYEAEKRIALRGGPRFTRQSSQ